LAQGPAQSSADEVAEIKMLLETESNRRKAAEEELTHLKRQLGKYTKPEVSFFQMENFSGILFLFPIMYFWYIRNFLLCTRQERIWRLQSFATSWRMKLFRRRNSKKK